jgi:rhamnosyltransferase
VTRVSIIIPTLNAGPRFARTLEAIAAQDLDEPYEVVVIDSGSTDGTRELARRHGARVIAIDPADFGHGRTRNAGIAACGSDYVALLVQDAVPADQHWLSALVQALDEYPNAAGAASRPLPREDAGFVERYLAMRGPHADTGDDPIEQHGPSESQLLGASPEDVRRRCAFDDTSSIVRRAAWEQYPFPDVAYAEDLAWSAGVMRLGYSIVYVPASRVYHSHRRSCWYEVRRAYVDRRALLALQAAIAPLQGPSVRRTAGSPARVLSLVREMTRAARAERALTPRVWWTIRARVLAGAIGAGLANLTAGRPGGLRPRALERCLTRGV